MVKNINGKFRLKSMPETTKTCQVKMHDGKPCGRELYDDECCIFHSKKEDKDGELFQKGLDGILRVVSVETHDLTSFIFPDGVTFLSRFSRPVIFQGATFVGVADFAGATFKGEADFSEATFKGEASFSTAVFEGDAHFGRIVFEQKAYFADAIFKGEASFWDTVFKDWAHFGNVAFKGGALLWGTTFECGVNLLGAVFEDSLSINAEFCDNKKLFHSEADFTCVKLSKPEKTEFQKVDLSNVRFLETDLRGVHFTDVEWYREKGTGRNRVFDEVETPIFRNFDYALIAQLYRRLRANYEENLQYSEAGDFYIGEMEMTRKAEKNIFKKLPLLFYKAISNYGESYYRPLGWIAAILLIFPLLFMFAGIQPISFDPNNPMEDVIHYRLDFSSTQSFSPTTEKVGDYYTSFLYSMSVFSFIRDKKYTTIDNWGHTLFVLESILGPVTLAFFLLALRRRFKR